MGTAGTSLILALACVLASAAVAKRAARLAPVATGELALAAASPVLPARLSAAVLAVVFTAFTAVHVRSWRAGLAGCDCFGAGAEVPALRAGLLTALAAALAAAVAVAGAPSIIGLGSSDPGAVPVVVLAAIAGAAAWRLAFTIRLDPGEGATDALVRSSALFLERRMTRRTALQRVALVGSALAVAPLRYLLYPGTALAAIGPSDCKKKKLCSDGWTAFCCQINNGLNACPEGTFPGGWWMCTDYAGRLLCAEQGVRYYVDCNELPGRQFPGGCRCADGTCDERRVACNVFRYGQCNTDVPAVTAVVCRLVLCENPSTVAGLNCNASLTVENAVCHHEAPCLGDAQQLVGAGGV